MRARLVVESGQAYPPIAELREDQVVRLGRNRENTIILRDHHASRWHAEIQWHDGHWVLRDCGTTNGTRVNNLRIEGPHTLLEGEEVRVGDTCFRFHLEQSEEGTAEFPALPDNHARVSKSSDPGSDASPPTPNDGIDPPPTDLNPDEMTALFLFLDGSLRENTPRGLVKLALETVHQHTKATVSGYLSLDEDDPLPKIVLPDRGQVDTHLSKQLTQRVQKEGRTAWLTEDGDSKDPTDSLVSYCDAICVPIQGKTTPQGALHVYKISGVFQEREVHFCELLAGYLSRSLSGLRSRMALEADNSRLRIHTSGTDQELVGDSAPMRHLRDQARRLADRPKVLLICGESGSGKELVALALHRFSTRREGPLVAVNCAAITPSLIESELFGHVKGAFTTATEDHPGYFQQADTGTLFLDEIGELPEPCQAKLLRVLETGCFRPVGGRKEIKTDVRILAATNRDLKQECLANKFRKDLFFRLGVEIRVPPLRDRREDIPALVKHFLARLTVEYRRNVRLTAAALERLQMYHWPGNVRQLRCILENAVAMSDGELIDADALPVGPDSLSGVQASEPTLNLKELEAWAIRQALKRTNGTMIQAARLLGIHRDTLMAKLKAYDIDKNV